MEKKPLDGAAPRRSIGDVTTPVRAALAPLGRRLSSGLSSAAGSWRRTGVHFAGTCARALGAHVGAVLSRHLDGGLRPPDASPPAPDDNAITVENLDLGYGSRLAVAGLSGIFAPASLTAIVGPNGAGKTSLLKALAGIMAPRSGKIACAARAGKCLGYLPQQSELDRDYPITVTELVALGRWREFGAFRPPAKNLAAPIEEAIGAVGLQDLVDRPIGELSAGQFQRVLFARLVLQDAAVILLDEPFAAIDESTTEDLLGLIERWHAERRTVVAVLHDVDQVRAHFPDTLLLARSCIAWGDTATTLTPDNLVRARAALQPPAGKPVKVAA